MPPSIRASATVLARPMAVNAGGKVASATRDLAPFVVFGVGSTLDSAVLAMVVGSILGATAVTLALPICVPMIVTGSPRYPVVRRRFLGAFVGLAVLALVLQGPALDYLSADPHGGGTGRLYQLAILAGLLQVPTALLTARLYATGTSQVGLAMPFFAGAAVPVALLLHPSLTALGVGLVAGAALDLGVAAWVRLGRVASPGERTGSGADSVPVDRARLEFLVTSQALALLVILGERALMARGAVGVAGAVAIAARASYALVSLAAGSLEPQVIRRVAAMAGNTAERVRRLARVTYLVGLSSVAVCAGLAWMLVALDRSVLSTAVVLYLASTPAAVCFRLSRAAFYGQQSFGVDLSLTAVGGAITLAVAGAALASGADPIFALAVPISSSVLAAAAGAYGLRHWPSGGAA